MSSNLCLAKILYGDCSNQKCTYNHDTKEALKMGFNFCPKGCGRMYDKNFSAYADPMCPPCHNFSLNRDKCSNRRCNEWFNIDGGVCPKCNFVYKYPSGTHTCVNCPRKLHPKCDFDTCYTCYIPNPRNYSNIELPIVPDTGFACPESIARCGFGKRCSECDLFLSGRKRCSFATDANRPCANTFNRNAKHDVCFSCSMEINGKYLCAQKRCKTFTPITDGKYCSEHRHSAPTTATKIASPSISVGATSSNSNNKNDTHRVNDNNCDTVSAAQCNADKKLLSVQDDLSAATERSSFQDLTVSAQTFGPSLDAFAERIPFAFEEDFEPGAVGSVDAVGGAVQSIEAVRAVRAVQTAAGASDVHLRKHPNCSLLKPVTVRLQVWMPDALQARRVFADSVEELASELGLPPTHKFCFSLLHPTPQQLDPPTFTDQELWGFAKNTTVYAYQTRCAVSFELQRVLRPTLEMLDKCSFCGLLLEHRSHHTSK